MRKQFPLIWLLFLLISACGNASNTDNANARVTLNIYHSNDIMGYVRPCG